MSATYRAPWARGSASRPSASHADPNMRVSDAERAEVADRLSKHYSDGRLDEAEFNERIDQAMRAKTHADLSGGQAAWRRVASETSRIAREQGLVVQPGTPIDVVVTSGTHMVGRGQLTVHPVPVVG